MSEIGALIRELRLVHGIGLNEFSDIVNMDAANLSRFERGGGGIKLPDSLYPIAKVLGTTVPAIFLLLEKTRQDKTLLMDRENLVRMVSRINTAISKI